jgi:hypothetical protein
LKKEKIVKWDKKNARVSKILLPPFKPITFFQLGFRNTQVILLITFVDDGDG